MLVGSSSSGGASPVAALAPSGAASAANAGLPGYTANGTPLFTQRSTSFPFRFLFHHMSRLVSTGYARTLENGDFFPSPSLATEALASEFERDWAVELKKEQPSLWRALSQGTDRIFLARRSRPCRLASLY
jgi:hypothetical protein